MRVLAELQAFVRASLLDPVESHSPEPVAAQRRRRAVSVATLVAGAACLGWSLSIRPGDPLFYPAALAVAAIWAIGSVLAGPLRLGRARTRAGGSSRSVLQGLVLGAGLLAIFLAGAVAVGRIGWLRAPVDQLMAHAGQGVLWLVALITFVSGMAEELFFRGALFAALPPRWAVAVSTLTYGLVTMTSGVPLLVFAALVLGLLTALQRRVTGGVLGPIVTHLTWSLGMLFALPTALNLWSGP